MLLKLFKSKIHRATITDADLNYEGSCSIDPLLMREAGILENESVWIWNINNGERLMTYAIPGKSGQIGLNGSAARLGHVGDLVIISTFADMEEAKAVAFRPTVVLVNKANEITSITRKSGHLKGEISERTIKLMKRLPGGFTASTATIEGGYLATVKLSYNAIHLIHKFNIHDGSIINGANDMYLTYERFSFGQPDFQFLFDLVRFECGIDDA